ncbi:hypothetical protein BC938DRAFT_478572 [Jimgerdemannia flammicorona]|uniref:Uncharacterized protein n=1 Tax=Jimgerdemannia flammicorona TaxID=994334 RepID=A0A433QY88_9FUNG|nr:hypothetical protein BC938DRAFT_478572 [Jimgerdemannia flammicorona]
MRTANFIFALSLLFLILSVPNVNGECSRYWSGTAPFCAGSCPEGYTEITRSSCGDGACCWTGYKVLCEKCIDLSNAQFVFM